MVRGLSWTVGSVICFYYFFSFAASVKANAGRAPLPGDKIENQIEWKRAPHEAEWHNLDAWQKGVGPPVIMTTRKSEQNDGPLDSLMVVTWNTKVGGADIKRFIQDLSSGRLTSGKPVQDFVLLLQEVFRRDSSVPDTISPDVRFGSYIGSAPPSGERIDIVKTAEQEALFLFYVPLMRNGRAEETDVPEDRGNAILSTRPLSHYTVVELPYERQRRLAVAANLSGQTTAGSPWTIRVVSAHLENRSRWQKALRSFGSGRLRQVKALVGALSGSTPTALGGDFNTWFGEDREAAISYARRFFNQPPPFLGPGTVKLGFLQSEREVDYLFFRLPEGWSGAYNRVDNRYGSDHYPLLGQIRIVNGDSSTR